MQKYKSNDVVAISLISNFLNKSASLDFIDKYPVVLVYRE